MTTNTVHFVSGRDVHNFFRSNRQAVPLEGLKALRNQISLKHGENLVSLQDARLVLVKEWLELSSGAQDIFAVLDKRSQPAVEGVCFSILASMVSLTSHHLIYQPLGFPIVKALLTPRWLRRVGSLISGGQSDACISTLKLLVSISNFAGGKEQKSLLESFSWEVKTFQKLLYMRRREKSPNHDTLARPDIRTLCLQFILSFLSSSSHIKTMFLEQHRDIVLSIFKGLGDDSYSVIHYVLETLWTKLWQDQKIRRTLKVALFGEKTMQHLLKLYERSEQVGNAENVPANVVHHFLLAICTHRGIGICFADNGWYPRQEPERESSSKSERIYNKILANVLKMLKVGDDARQQELALKVLRACPELTAGYLRFLAPTLEPRLTTKWLANAAFFGTIVSLPVPVESFYLRRTDPSPSNVQTAYQPAPPPPSTVADNIIPLAIVKTYLTKALQSQYPLMQHSAGLLLAQCLRKCEAVQDAFRAIQQALEEDEVEGQWARCLNEVERETRRRVPEISVVIAFASAQQATSGSSTRSAMLAEVSHRLLWLYHRCMPSLVAEARYDLAKSLRSVLNANNEDRDGTQLSKEIRGLRRLQQLHVLRMLVESDQFLWNAKAAPAGPSNLYILLDLYLKAGHLSIRQAVSTLLADALRDSLLFQHDPEELHIWFDALPMGVRPSDAETPDGAQLTNEGQCVMSFLEACMQRCAKTPHRYIEELDAFVAPSEEPGSTSSISPLLITVLEQLSAKRRTESLQPSDALALTTYIRKVLVALLGKQSSARVLSDFAVKLRTAVTGDGAFENFPTVAAALQKECEILDRCLAWCSSTRHKVEKPIATPSDAVNEFVARVEELEHEGQSGISQAYELVDWIRLVDQPLSAAIVGQVASVVKRLHAPALSSFCLHLVPGSGFLWALPDDDLANYVPVDWLLLHGDQDVLAERRCLSVFQTALRRNRRALYEYKRITGLVMHRLHEHAVSTDVVAVCETLELVLESAKGELSSHDFSALKTFVLAERRNLRRLSCTLELHQSVTSTIGQLLDLMLDTTSTSDRQLVSPICDYWVSTIIDCLEHPLWQRLHGSFIWIRFMQYNDLIGITERVLCSFESDVGPAAPIDGELLQLIKGLLIVLEACEDSTLSKWYNQHLTEFISLRRFLSTTELLDKIILRAVSASLPLGYDGFRSVESGISLRSATRKAEVCWSSRQLQLPQGASVATLLDQSDWTTEMSRAIASFLYRSLGARQTFWSWLVSGDLSRKPGLKMLVPAIYAFFDARSDEKLSDNEERSFTNSLFRAILKEFCGNSLEGEDAAMYGSCIAHLVKAFPLQEDDLLQQVSSEFHSLPTETLHPEALRLAHFLIGVYGKKSAAFMESILSYALKWVVRHMSDEQESTGLNERSLAAITDVVRLCPAVAGHFADPVISVAIRHHICHPHSIYLAEALLAKVNVKPVNLNRYLQSVVQHVHLSRLAASDPASQERTAIAKFLFTLFSRHPTNTCQPSHVEPLIQLYSGSLSLADRLILAIFLLFEEQRQLSIASLITYWSQLKVSSQQTSLDVLSNLDATRVLRTYLTFPDRRSVATHVEGEILVSRMEDAMLYDPVFLLLLFAQATEERSPQSALSWVALFRTNIVSFLVRCQSSADRTIRKAAILQLERVYEMMQTVDMQEKAQVVYLLDLLRYSLQGPSDPSDEDVPRLPSYITLFLAHALRGIFYPANFIYPLSARFLLQRPELDVQDVPMLYSMLFNSGDNWKKERGWIVRFLADGMTSSSDWRLLKRRHTWDLLASLFQGSYDDKALRHAILDVLANLTCQFRATCSLILRSSMVHWIEMQLLVLKRDEAIAWAKIIENILVVIDKVQVERQTRGEWQRGLLRCLGCLITGSDISLLRLISCALLRLSNGIDDNCATMKHVLECALARLRVLEDQSGILLCTDIKCHADVTQDLPPHRSTRLHNLSGDNGIKTWGKTVENLWSVSLKHGISGSVWDQLSSRLMLWRSLIGDRETPIGEWARRQVVHCLPLE